VNASEAPLRRRAPGGHFPSKPRPIDAWRRSVTARLPWVELNVDEPVQVNLDGEPIAGKTLWFEVLPGALEPCLPEEAPVLRKT
jgi:diacylglycerol kinase family enzyme